jgi:hypothetical protein
MIKQSVTLLVFLALGLVLIACATPPKEEMDRALETVFRAESDPDAVAYAPLLLVRARDALTRMQSEADAKNYEEAKRFAAEAINNAERAIADGRVAAANARTEAARLLDTVSDTLAETSSTVNAAGGLQGLSYDLDELSGEVQLAQNTYDDAQQYFEEENYVDAIANAETVRSLLSGVNTKVNGAAGAASRKK